MSGKVIIIRYEFDEEDWEYFKSIYTEKEIRKILEEEGSGQLRYMVMSHTGEYADEYAH